MSGRDEVLARIASASQAAGVGVAVPEASARYRTRGDRSGPTGPPDPEAR